MEAYLIAVNEVIKRLNVDSNKGLSENEAEIRQQKFGYNCLRSIKPRTIVSIFVSQFENPLVYILFFAALIIFIFGQDKLDAFIISGVLFFNAILGTIQETRTKNIIENLKRFIKTESVVLRNGNKTVVNDNNLVVGDIIFLQEGQRIPADARIIISNNLRVDESILTGEAHSIEKNSDVIDHTVPIGDRKNMLFRGTYIIAGAGKAVVVAIGTDAEIGKIQVMTEEIDTDIPLRKELDRLSHWILIFILSTCLFLFVIGVFTGKPIKELLVMLTALFICVVPEGLPVVLTLVLVAGALQMAKHFVLVRNMQAVEALGRTDVIVIDKTGTLTRNEMIVSRVWADNNRWDVTGQGYHCIGTICHKGVAIEELTSNNPLMYMAIASTLLNNAEIIHLSKLDIFDIKGDPTEAALFIFGQKVGQRVQEQIDTYTKKYEIPFDSDKRYHAGFYYHTNGAVAFIIGSPETVLQRCSQKPTNAETIVNQFLDDGLRVVAIGMKKFSSNAYKNCNTMEEYQKLITSDIHLLGFAGIEDSIRSEVVTVIMQARDAGLSIIMATGDHQKTALHVAKQVGIFRPGDDCLDGSVIDTLSDEDLLKRINHITVFSRVSPIHKMRIVEILQCTGKIVAMTGDGINDAPSLVKADLGIAMGNIGTEVAKQAADLVLLNDSFINIVHAIEQGRHIFYTLKRIVLYFFSTNMGEILIVLFAFLMTLIVGIDLPLPITAVQILWLNLVTDGFLDVGLSMEPKEKNLLKHFWLEKKQRLIDGALLLKMLFMAIPMAAGSLIIFLFYYQQDLAYARTMTLITMAMYQWFNAWSCRSATESLFSIGFFSNRWLIAVMALVFALQSAIVYIPFMRAIFKTVPLGLHDWLLIIAITAPIVLIEEIRKVIARQWYSKKNIYTNPPKTL